VKRGGPLRTTTRLRTTKPLRARRPWAPKPRTKPYGRGEPWETVRALVMARDGHRCLRCDRAGEFPPHHLTHVGAGGENAVWNLVSLDPDCHRMEESGQGLGKRYWYEYLQRVFGYRYGEGEVPAIAALCGGG
jgi:5-methylcytosine-specific restriction endonuclease McrA